MDEANLLTMKKTQLQECLAQFNLPTTGNKAELVQRIIAAEKAEDAALSNNMNVGTEKSSQSSYPISQFEVDNSNQNTVLEANKAKLEPTVNVDEQNSKPSDSVSNVSKITKNTNVSNSSSVARKLAAKKAALSIRLEALNETQQLEQKRRQMERQAEEQRRDLERQAEEQRRELEQQAEEEKRMIEARKERLELETRLREVEAQEQIYSEHGSVSCSRKSEGKKTILKSLPSEVSASKVERWMSNQKQTPLTREIGDSMPDKVNLSAVRRRHAKNTVDRESIAFQPPLSSTAKPVPFKQASETNPIQQNFGDLTALVNCMSLPKTEIRKFNGDFLQFWCFIREFDNRVSSKTSDESLKYSLLLNYCTGVAYETIKPFSVLPQDQAYKKARERLEQKFGNEYIIVEKWIAKLTERRTLRGNDVTELVTFSETLANCYHTLSSLNKLSEINTQSFLQRIVNKLPEYLKNQWRKQAHNTIKLGRSPTIADLQAFVEDAAEEATNPVFGITRNQPSEQLDKNKPVRSKINYNFSLNTDKKHHERLKDKQNLSDSRKQVSANLATTSSKSKDFSKPCVDNVEFKRPTDKTMVFTNSLVKKPSFSCFYCKEEHSLLKCPKFAKLPTADRKKFTFEQKLCLLCFSNKHEVKDCPKEYRCSYCKDKHSYLLHPTKGPDQNRDPIQTKGANFATEAGNDVALPVVPVFVKGDNNKVVKTFALLDSGSTNTFCSSRLLQKLGVKGSQESMEVNSIAGLRKLDTSSLNLAIRGQADDCEWLDKMKVHSVPSLEVCEGYYINNFDNLSKQLDLNCIGKTDKHNVELIVGQDMPQALQPLEVKLENLGDAYAVKTSLGWTINGPVQSLVTSDKKRLNFSVQNLDTTLDNMVERFWTIDSACISRSSLNQAEGLSKDDEKVLSIWDASLEHRGNHYQFDIPFRQVNRLPDSKPMACKRLRLLKTRFQKNQDLYDKYVENMNDLFTRGYAEPAPIMGPDENCWYLPHFAVHNVSKKKLRVVFDCAAQCDGVSLNSLAYQGPDLMQSLLGVLLRFRQYPVAIMGDIEQMFHQVFVSPKHRNFLRFLWWEGGDFTKPIQEYRMTVHLFGGVWSPSCANYALRRTALDNADNPDYDQETIDSVVRDFYVDDLLKSVPTADEAIKLVRQLSSLLKCGGFRLTKWVSNSWHVLHQIPTSELVKDIDLNLGHVPQERALGILWDVMNDNFTVRAMKKHRGYTKRGLLSVVSSLYDPLGFVSPYILVAKLIFQDLCREKLGWDDDIPDTAKVAWDVWLEELQAINDMKVPRCVCKVSRGDIERMEVHLFCDASQKGYGSVAYLKVLHWDGKVSIQMLISKSRLAPLKSMTIPRLELSSAVVAVRMNQVLCSELTLELSNSVFYTDSQIVLGYINNNNKRFKVFVANRVSEITHHTRPDQWHFVPSEHNPADLLSRGCSAKALIGNKMWLQGPEFLLETHSANNQFDSQVKYNIDDNDTEVLKQHSQLFLTESTEPKLLSKLICRYSDYSRLLRAVAILRKFVSFLRKEKFSRFMKAQDLKLAEVSLLRFVQSKSYSQEIYTLRSQKTINKNSSIAPLAPSLDHDGLLRVDSRLRHATISHDARNPIIVPRDHHLTLLIVRHYHANVGMHVGREHTLSLIRTKFWIPRARVIVRAVLKQCVPCMRTRPIAGNQLLADLPPERVLATSRAFEHVGFDAFGHFYVKRGRTREKRWGCIFTCLTMRAIHLEVLFSLDVSSFINTLVRFCARRGVPTYMLSDNAGNFVGTEKELRTALATLPDSPQLNSSLSEKGITWDFNTPVASHHGGVWERQIRTVRRIIDANMKDQVFSEDSLTTLFCEVENIVNSRPLTANSDDTLDELALTPNHLLRLQSDNHIITLQDVRQGININKRWRHVQRMVETFWNRWTREYLSSLHFRTVNTARDRNFRVGDVVFLLGTNPPRGKWPLGRIVDVFPGRDGLVRSVKVRTSQGEYVRPITKVSLIEGYH